MQKELILQKARALFSKRGYGQTNMKLLGKSCNFEVGNIYTYFRSKEEILFEILMTDFAVINSATEKCVRDHPGSPDEQLRSFLRRAVGFGQTRGSGHFYERESRHLLPIHRRKIIQCRDQYESILRRIIESGISRGVFKETDVSMACKCIVSILVRINLWYSRTGRLTRDEVADYIFNFALGAIGSRHSQQ